MSSNRIVFSGLEELKESLRNLPADLAGEASHVVEGAANAAMVAMGSGYASHWHSGNLQKGLQVTHFEPGRFSAGAIVKNTAKHAYIFENGTEARYYYTMRGAKHVTGKMPPGHVFIPAAIRARRAMYEGLSDVVTRHGFSVTGTP